MIKFLMFHLEKDFNKYDKLLRSKQKCITYSTFKDTADSCVDSIFLIERYRSIQRKSFYVDYGVKERLIDFLLSLNAKFRIPVVRFTLDVIALNIQTCVVSTLVIFSRRKAIVETGLGGKLGGISLYPSFISYFRNIYRPLSSMSCKVYPEQNNVKSFCVTKDIFRKFQLAGLVILIPVFIFEMALYIRTQSNNTFYGFYCLGTMCIVNRFYAVVLKQNGYEVHLEDHGIVRDCVAEYAIFTHAAGYKDGARPISED